MTRRPSPILSLEPVLRCPRCATLFASWGAVEVFVGALVCRRCRGHWWATRFEAGNVRDQLVRDYDGDADLADRLMSTFTLPAIVSAAVWWQIMLTGNEYHHYTRETRTTNARAISHALLTRLSAVHQGVKP